MKTPAQAHGVYLDCRLIFLRAVGVDTVWTVIGDMIKIDVE